MEKRTDSQKNNNLVTTIYGKRHFAIVCNLLVA